MPLARGTAAVGYTTLLALFLAVGAPIVSPIPPDTQVDWEAILAPSPAAFIAAVAPWLLPPAVRPGAGKAAAAAAAGEGAGALPPVASMPEVASLLRTMRLRLEALNGPDAPRI
jgi:hypothetical protein